MLFFLVTSASAVTFVINDGDASLSLSATSDHDVAFSNVIAENPDSYSATMSADDNGGASASQESTIEGADSIFTASAGISSDGSSSYTFTETIGGSSTSTQTGYAGQGCSSVEQQTTSDAVAGASVSGSTDSQGNKATESSAFMVGVNTINLTADTTECATASLDGFFAGLWANTLGIARSITGANSTTGSFVAGGLMKYNATAMVNSTTNASQDVSMIGASGAAFSAANDASGNSAVESVGFFAGVLNASNSANTENSATASQSGITAGIAANSFGIAHSQDDELSTTHANLFAGLMSFNGTAMADGTTAASQDVGMAGLSGSAGAFSTDGSGNATSQSAEFALGTMDLIQQANTTGSTYATQNGTITAAVGGTSGHATSGGQVSSTDTDMVLGSMEFDGATTADDNTNAGQSLDMIALFGSASARSDDGAGNATREGSEFVLGAMNTTQLVDTSGSAHATQTGEMAALYGTTWGGAKSGSERSGTETEMWVGAMSFGNNATADGSTDAGQSLDMAALYGSAYARSNDGTGNVTEEGSEIVLGTMNTTQSADTLGSAHTAQTGELAALYGTIWGNATSGSEQSRSEAEVLVGAMSFGNYADADRDTDAGQSLEMAALSGSAAAGSEDGTGNITLQRSEFILGVMNTTQEADTSGSTHATQSGELAALHGTTRGGAISGGELSVTEGEVWVGAMSFGNNATAGDSTEAAQSLRMAALYGEASAVSQDGKGNVTSEGSKFILGEMNATQLANTSGSTYAAQSGDLSALYGTTWGQATSGIEESWTDADVLIGAMSFGNYATANGHTSAGQTVDVDGNLLSIAGMADANAGSNDGKGNVTEVGSGIILGTLNVDQLADTSGSADASQAGDMSAGYGSTWGQAASGNEESWTDADVLVGAMSFGNNATANGHTSAGQSLDMAALYGSVSARSDDGTGNVTEEGSEIILGTMNTTQLADTSGSAHAAQSGDLAALYGTTLGNAMSGDEQSWTEAQALVGTMTFGGNATANGHTGAGQSLDMATLYGNATAGSNDGLGNVTGEGSEVIVGTLDITQQVDTGGSAHAVQSGDLAALYGTTWGTATSGDEQSWTDADVIIGGASFDNNAVADGHTEVGQNLIGLGLYGNVTAGSHEGANDTEVGTGFILGYFDISQQANTSSSAHANQSGTLIAGLGNTWGNATSGEAQSWTRSDMFVGMITIGDNTMTTGAGTSAVQDLSIAALNGSASAGSSDGMANTTEVGAEVSGGNFTELLETDWSSLDLNDIPGLVTDIVGDIGGGYIDVDQTADTSGSSHAAQSGSVVALGGGRTWANATSGAGDQSWTTSNVTTGIVVLNSNHADAGISTGADQDVFIVGIQASAVAGSSDGTGNSTVGAQFDGSGNATSLNVEGLVNFVENPSISNFTAWIDGIGDVGTGYLSMEQQTGSNGGTNAYQSGTSGLGILPSGVNVYNANGSTWSEAASGSNRSWTTANVTSTSVLVPGIITVNSNGVSAGTDGTSASQDVRVVALTGDATVGSTDGASTVGMGAAFTAGTLGMDQVTGAGIGASASQDGRVSGSTAQTWGNATSSDEQSWTAANANGFIVLNNNEVTAGGSTSGVQDLSISGSNADASVGSTNGTNSVEVGAKFINGVILTNYINMNQQTDTSGSALASQQGSVTATFGTGSTWGTAISGDGDTSFTTATINSGTLKVNSNSVFADDEHTTAGQSLNLSGTGGGSAMTGSVNSIDGNYATVSAGYLSSGLRTSSLDVVQNTETDQSGYIGCATASQPYAKIVSYSTTMGGAWTHSEAGNSSGRLVYTDTKAKSGTGGIFSTPRGVTITSDSSAVGGLTSSVTFEHKTSVKSDSGSGGNPTSNSSVYASNGIGTPAFDYSPDPTTTASAWADLINTYANV